MKNRIKIKFFLKVNIVVFVALVLILPSSPLIAGLTSKTDAETIENNIFCNEIEIIKGSSEPRPCQKNPLKPTDADKFRKLLNPIKKEKIYDEDKIYQEIEETENKVLVVNETIGDKHVKYWEHVIDGINIKNDSILLHTSIEDGKIVEYERNWANSDSFSDILTDDKDVSFEPSEDYFWKEIVLFPDEDDCGSFYTFDSSQRYPLTCYEIRFNDGTTTMFDFDGTEIGYGIPAPYREGFSLSGYDDDTPGHDPWLEFRQNAHNRFSNWCDSATSISWPSLSTISSYVSDPDVMFFYELAHGGSYSFRANENEHYRSSSGDHNVRDDMANRPPIRFAFIGSCEGMHSTGEGTFSYEFRKGEMTNTVTIGYNDMSDSPAWPYALDWQTRLFTQCGVPSGDGDTFYDAFLTANAYFPLMTDYVVFVGDYNVGVNTPIGILTDINVNPNPVPYGEDTDVTISGENYDGDGGYFRLGLWTELHGDQWTDYEWLNEDDSMTHIYTIEDVIVDIDCIAMMQYWDGDEWIFHEIETFEIDVTDPNPPGNPSNLNAYNPTPSSIQLSWTKGSGSTHTMIRRSTSGYPSSPSSGSQAYFSTGTSTTDSGLSPQTTYYYRAWAYDSSTGLYSTGYSQDYATTTSTGGSYHISGWVVGDGKNGVTISFSGGHGSTTTASNGYYYKDGFPDGTYTVTPSKSGYYFVPSSREAVISGGPANTINFNIYPGSPPDPPGNPSNLNAYNPASSSIQLSWTKGSGSDKTMIRRSTSGYPSSPSSGSQVYFSTGTSTTDSGLNPQTTYYYRAWAYDSSTGLYSTGYSQDYETTLPAGNPQGIITYFTVTPNPVQSGGSVTATVTGQNIGNEAGYFILGLWTYQHADHWSEWTWLTPSQTLQYQYIFDNINDDTYCQATIWYWDGVETFLHDEEWITIEIIHDPPGDPSSLNAHSPTFDSIQLSWSKGSGSDMTMIRRSTSGYPSSPSSGSQAYFGTGTSTINAGLNFGQIYYYRAWAYDSGTGLYSTGYSSDFEYTLPDSAFNLNAYNPTSSSIQLSWTKGSGSDMTMIRRSTSGYPSSPSSGSLAYFDTGTSTTDSGLNPETTYYYRAWAYDSDSGYYSAAYSQDYDTTTPEIQPPSVQTDDATDISITSATLNGYVIDDGGEPCLVWFEYGTTTDYGIETPIQFTSSEEEFNQYIEGLSPNTVYHFRAVANNPAGTIYGSDKTFITLDLDWPMFHRDPAHTGYTRSTGPDEPWIKWSVPLDGWYASDDTDSGPVVANGYVYVNGDDYLYCLDEETGEELWREEFLTVRWASPAVANGRVFVSDASQVHCLDALTGERIWESQDLINDSLIFQCSPVILDDKIYVSGMQIYCLDAEGNGEGTTTLLWNTSVDFRWGVKGITISENKIYAFSKPNISCFNLEDGSLIWQNQTVDEGWFDRMPTIPVVADGCVFIGGVDQWNDFYLYVFYAENGTRKYRKNLPGEAGSESIPAVADGKIYIAGDDDLFCLYTSNGTEIWRYDFPTFGVRSSPAVTSDGKLYIGLGVGQTQHHEHGMVVCLDTETGEEIWSHTTMTEVGVMSSPAIVNGKLFIKFDGSIHCFDNTLDWPMFRHDQSHSGCSISSAPNTNNTIWINETGDSIVSSPAVVDGYVYVGSNDGKLYCFDVSDGTEKWNFTTQGAVRSSPAVIDGKVYFGSDDNNIYCLNTSDGNHVWNFTTNAPVSSSPVITDDRFLIGSHDGKVYCLDADPSDGDDEGIDDPDGISYDLIWVYDELQGGWITSSPAINDDFGYVVTIYPTRLELHKFNLTNGDYQWHIPIGRWYGHFDQTTGTVTGGSSSPTVINGFVYVGSDSGDVYCFDANTGEQLWQTQIGDGWISSPAVANGYVYVGQDDSSKHIVCLNTSDGSEEWSVSFDPADGGVKSSPALADGKVYIGSDDNNIYCLNAENGDMIWNYTTYNKVWSSPAIANGNVYIASTDGKIYAFEDPN